MADHVTKKDLQEVASSIIEAVDFRFQKMEVHLDQRFSKLDSRISTLEESVNRLSITLDNFVKMMTDYKGEFTILKGEVDQIKRILKEKLGVEISV